MRALLLGAAAAVVGGAFGVVCAGVLCLSDGLQWAFAGWCGLRGAFAGLVAGAIMGAASGIYHVEEPAAKAAPAPPRQAGAPNRAFLPSGLLAVFYRNGARPRR